MRRSNAHKFQVMSLKRKGITYPHFLSLRAGTGWKTDVGWVTLDYVDEESILKMLDNETEKIWSLREFTEQDVLT